MSDNQSDNAPDWDLTLRNAARRNAKVILPELDCRTCKNMQFWYGRCNLGYLKCINGDHYEPLPPLRLWGV